jgi:sugar phosphate isomerase/epimerase
MKLGGFADEAADDIAGQIKATKELGWKCIEARGVNGKNINDIPESDFLAVVKELQQSDVYVNCYGSTLANWSMKITDPFELTFDAAKRAVERMKLLGTKMIRIMSYAVIKDVDDQMEQERFKRLREMHKLFADNGMSALHENCMNYGGMSWKHTIKLIENVPGMKLIYDTGNPVFTEDHSKEKPYPKQSSREFYNHVKKYVQHIHIKDCIFEDNFKKHTFPGEGNGDVCKVLEDLVKSGYKGDISIEPHMGIVYHEKQQVKASPEQRYATYIEYGKRLMKILNGFGVKYIK